MNGLQQRGERDGSGCVPTTATKVTRETDRLVELTDSLNMITSRLVARVGDLAGYIGIPEASNKPTVASDSTGLLEQQNNSITFSLSVLKLVADRLEQL